MMQDVSLAAAFGRLLVVAVLMAAVLLVLRRVSKGGKPVRGRAKRGATSRAIEIVDRQALGKTQSVAVLRVHDTTLVVGVTEQRIDLLATLDPAYEDVGFDDEAGDDLDDGYIDLTGFDVRDDDDEFFAKLRRRSAR